MIAMDAVADPTRRRIVEMLAQYERSAGEIVKAFSMSAPAISQHLKILQKARLVSVRVEGQRRIQTLNPAGLHEIEAWVAKTKRFWDTRLDVLERELKAEDALEKKKKTKESHPHE
jgi:DNA-binding transcriptional ArsR family regulator